VAGNNEFISNDEECTTRNRADNYYFSNHHTRKQLLIAYRDKLEETQNRALGYAQEADMWQERATTAETKLARISRSLQEFSQEENKRQ
jgi:hypothetical protein